MLVVERVKSLGASSETKSALSSSILALANSTNDPEAPLLQCASYDARCGRCRERWDRMVWAPEVDFHV